MTELADLSPSLEGVLKDEILRMYQEVASAVVPRFRFRKTSTQTSAEPSGVKAVMMTALKPSPG